jgi:hypothetical protein
MPLSRWLGGSLLIWQLCPSERITTMFNEQTDLTNLIAELAEAEKEWEQCGINLGLDPDNWEVQDRFDAQHKIC